MICFGFFFLHPSEPPKDDGGAEITKYVVELSEGLSGMSEILLLKEVVIYLESHKKNRSLFCKFVVIFFEGLSWELVYSGPAKEHVCEGLKPGCSYQTRVYCMSEGGQSPVSQCTVFFSFLGLFSIRFGPCIHS